MLVPDGATFPRATPRTHTPLTDAPRTADHPQRPHLEDLETSDVEDADEGGSLPLRPVK